MLECKNMYFRFGDSGWLLDNINISINTGEVVGLTGNSGSGKTTLARIFAGYLTPAKGDVLLDGNRLPGGFSPVQLLSQHPELSLNPRWKVGRILKEVNGNLSDEEIIDGLAVSRSWFGRYPHELSGGELQRICVARILDKRVRFLICDEISGMLDTITQAQVWSTVTDFCNKHTIGVLVISHNIDLLGRLCARKIDFQ